MSDAFDDKVDEQVGVPGPKKNNALNELIEILSTDKELKNMFCFNKFTNEMEHAQDNIILSHMAKKGTTVSDMDISCVRTILSTRNGFLVNRSNLEDALLHVAINNSYHPIKNYLDELR